MINSIPIKDIYDKKVPTILLDETYHRLEKQSVLNNILNSFGDRMIVACDRNRIIQYTNSNIFECLQAVLEKGKVLDTSVKCYNPDIAEAILNEEITTIVNDTAIVCDKEGSKHFFKTSYTPILSEREVVQGFLFTAEDITAEKKVFRELEKTKEKQQKSEVKIAENEALFRAIFEQAAVGVAQIDSTTSQFIQVNQHYCNIVGFTPAEMLKTNFETLTHPDDLQENLDQMKRLKSGEIEAFSMRKRFYKADGTIAWVKMNVSSLHWEDNALKSHIAIIEDITAQVLYERQLKQYAHIVSATTDLIAFIDDQHRYITVNDAYLKAHNKSFDEVVGSSVASVIGESNYQHVKPLLQKAFKGHEFTIEDKKIVDIQGNLKYEEGRFYPYKESDGKISAVVVNIKDISELKKKDELMIVQSRHAAMGEMIGMIAHQWRQPISVIALDANNMLIDIAFDDFDTEKAKVYADDILKQTQHLSKTIDDFRNFFKPDKSLAKVKLDELLEETSRMIKEGLANNGIALKTSYGLVSEIEAYPRELMQVFVNILNNAKDILVDKKIENPHIAIKLSEDEAYVNIVISDNGGGINEAVLPKVFDPYFTTKDERTGTGLGLYMSKMIIEDHLGGMLKAYNQDSGACFRVSLLKCNDKINTRVRG